MNKSDKSAKTTPTVKTEPATTRKPETEKRMDVPIHVSHPRREKVKLGKFTIAEGSQKFPKKPKE